MKRFVSVDVLRAIVSLATIVEPPYIELRKSRPPRPGCMEDNKMKPDDADTHGRPSDDYYELERYEETIDGN